MTEIAHADPEKSEKALEGSYEELTEKLYVAVKKTLNQNQDAWIRATYPDKVIIELYASDPNSLEASADSKTYEIPYIMDINGNISLKDPVEVKEKVSFEAVKIGVFVEKDDAKRLVTGPVLLPGCPDCDFQRGEKIFSVDEVASMCHSYNTFRISDEMHLYGATGKSIGEAVENWTLKEALKTENVNGDEVLLPVGTWMATVKITDDETWNKIEEGTYKGYSGTFLSKSHADDLLEALSANKHEEIFSDLFSCKRTLIKDLDNPVPVTISIVDRPCVPNAIFTSVKSAEKAGRRFSNATLNKLKSVFDNVQNQFKEITDLISAAENERTPDADKNKPHQLEVDDMNEDEIKQIIKDETQTLKDENEALKARIEELEKEPEPEPIPDEAGKNEDEGEKDPEPDPAIKALEEKIEAQEESIKALTEKLGVEPASQKLEGQDDDVDEEPVYKGRDDRDVFGCKIRK